MTECPTCGAAVINVRVHEEFHRRQRDQFVSLDAVARTYVSPPTYGGRR